MKKVVLITGALGGIGRALVKRYMELDCIVLATDIKPKPSDFNVSYYLEVDLIAFANDKSYANKMIDSIRELLGNRMLNTLINNAAIQILNKVSDLTRENWNDTLSVNLTAPFFMSQAFLKDLEFTNGSILNISSIHARLTKKNFSAYSTSKAAFSSMTRALALEIGDKIRVNAIEPAAINTPMLFDGFKNDLEAFNNLSTFHPSGVIGNPDDVAKLAEYITESSDRFFNGAVISLDGGISSRLFDPS